MATREQIRTYQDQLRAAGFDPGPSDGVNGPRTEAATRAFQRARGLQVDGDIGPVTSAALSQPAAAPAPTTGAVPRPRPQQVAAMDPMAAPLPQPNPMRGPPPLPPQNPARPNVPGPPLDRGAPMQVGRDIPGYVPEGWRPVPGGPADVPSPITPQMEAYAANPGQRSGITSMGTRGLPDLRAMSMREFTQLRDELARVPSRNQTPAIVEDDPAASSALTPAQLRQYRGGAIPGQPTVGQAPDYEHMNYDQLMAVGPAIRGIELGPAERARWTREFYRAFDERPPAPPAAAVPAAAPAGPAPFVPYSTTPTLIPLQGSIPGFSGPRPWGTEPTPPFRFDLQVEPPPAATAPPAAAVPAAAPGMLEAVEAESRRRIEALRAELARIDTSRGMQQSREIAWQGAGETVRQNPPQPYNASIGEGQYLPQEQRLLMQLQGNQNANPQAVTSPQLPFRGGFQTRPQDQVSALIQALRSGGQGEQANNPMLMRLLQGN